MIREKTEEEKAECLKQTKMVRDGDIKPSCYFTVYSDGEAMTIGREDFVSIIGTSPLFSFVEEI